MVRSGAAGTAAGWVGEEVIDMRDHKPVPPQRGTLDEAMMSIGRYVVISMIFAIVLVVRDIAPFWCAFPMATVWMTLHSAGYTLIIQHRKDR